MLPLLINLSGSSVYYYMLGNADLTLAVPVTNSLSFVMTLAAGFMLGESDLAKLDYLGIALVVFGVVLCVS